MPILYDNSVVSFALDILYDESLYIKISQILQLLVRYLADIEIFPILNLLTIGSKRQPTSDNENRTKSGQSLI